MKSFLNLTMTCPFWLNFNFTLFVIRITYLELKKLVPLGVNIEEILSIDFEFKNSNLQLGLKIQILNNHPAKDTEYIHQTIKVFLEEDQKY